jgi:hypothetical protein
VIPRLTGEVSEIVGNEVTLELGEVSQSAKTSQPADESAADKSVKETGGSEVSGSDGGEMHGKGNGEMPEIWLTEADQKCPMEKNLK